MTARRPGLARGVERLRRGLEERDLETIVALYAEDAELRIVEGGDPPAAPLRGRRAIADHYRDACSRDLTHRVEPTVVGEHVVAYTEVCRAPDGAGQVSAVILELREGRIARHLAVRASHDARGHPVPGAARR